MKKYIGKSMMALSAVLLLGGASVTTLDAVSAQESAETTETVESTESTVEESATTEESAPAEEGTESAAMEHDDEGRLPGGIKIEREPTYKVGDTVTSNATHMPGMEGAEAQIVAAFDTVAYEISYTPTDGSEPVENHRWIVHEEIAGDQEEPYAEGDEITVEAYHMPGMEGATATIDAVSEQTVYMIDYVDTETGETVINHKWVTEDELAPVEGSQAEEQPAASESETASEASDESSESAPSSEETTDESASSSEESTPAESESVPAESSAPESSSAE